MKRVTMFLYLFSIIWSLVHMVLVLVGFVRDPNVVKVAVLSGVLIAAGAEIVEGR